MLKKNVVVMFVLFFVIAFACSVFALECSTVLKQVIDTDTVLCKAEYDVDYTVEVKSDVKLDCDGSTLIGVKSNTAFLLNGTENSEIRNCNIVKFESGFYLENAQNNQIINNQILDSAKQSFYLKSSNSNKIYGNKINTALTYDALSNNVFCVDGAENSYVGVVGPGCEKPSDVDNAVTADQLDNVFSIISESTGLKVDRLKEGYESAKGKMTVKKTYQNNKVSIKLDADGPMTFAVYEFVPKATAQSASLIQTDAKVLKDDPLLMWEFTNVQTINLAYTLQSDIIESPKTIVIESAPVELESENDMKAVVYDEDIRVEDDPATAAKTAKLNSLLTVIVLVILCAGVIYLVQKKW